MVEFSSASQENEIHKLDSPVNEDPKFIPFSLGVLILGKGQP